jgi:hypothetical protein
MARRKWQPLGTSLSNPQRSTYGRSDIMLYEVEYLSLCSLK